MKKVSELEVGDFVKHMSRGFSIKCKVERLTKTQIIISGNRGTKFNRDSGCLVGANVWDSSYIFVWTDDDETQLIERRRVRRNKNLFELVNDLDPVKLSEEQYQTLLELYNNLLEAYNTFKN